MEEKKQRALEEVQAHYHKVCMELGELSFLMTHYKERIQSLNKQIFLLHQEADQLKKQKEKKHE